MHPILFNFGGIPIYTYGVLVAAGVLLSLWYGRLVGGVLTILLYTHFQKMPLLPTLDTCAAALPVGHAIGRMGCFFAGCCYGKPTTEPWGVIFTNPTAAQLAGTPLGVHLHPTQLYEASLEFL